LSCGPTSIGTICRMRRLFTVIFVATVIAYSGCKRESETSSGGDGSNGNASSKSAPPLPADAEINRFLLKVLSFWRYALKIYSYPIELEWAHNFIDLRKPKRESL